MTILSLHAALAIVAQAVAGRALELEVSHSCEEGHGFLTLELVLESTAVRPFMFHRGFPCGGLHVGPSLEVAPWVLNAKFKVKAPLLVKLYGPFYLLNELAMGPCNRSILTSRVVAARTALRVSLAIIGTVHTMRSTFVSVTCTRKGLTGYSIELEQYSVLVKSQLVTLPHIALTVIVNQLASHEVHALESSAWYMDCRAFTLGCFPTYFGHEAHESEV